MKHDLKLLLAATIALGLPVAAHAETTLTQAQITQIIKDVKTIDPGKAARPAVMKETLQGEQALRTGIDSRAELLFNDHTITRLGANTHFSFVEGTRNMSLQSGVMLLQVPKGIGGAKIETAAITAAVTGTTIMIEAGKNYTKLIVLEGECCLWPKNDKNGNNVFKFKHKTCATEGQEIILRNGSKVIPDPVYVNLKILEGTSLLITGNWNSPLNNTPINNAANSQGPGTYIPTNLAIIGAGTDVTVIQGQQPPPPGPPGPTGSSGTPPPGKYGTLFTIPGSFTIGGGSTLNTDPKIINGGVASYGRVYRGNILDGPPVPYLFGPGTDVSFPNDLEVEPDFPNYGIAAFKFGSLNITGVPAYQMSGNGATQMVLVSEGDITITNPNPTTLDFSPLIELDLLTAGGNINIGSNITITGLDSLELYSYGTANNVTIGGNVELGNGEAPDYEAGIQTDAINVDEEVEEDGDSVFKVRTQGNYIQDGDIDANSVNVKAGTYTENGDIGDNSYVGSVTVRSQGYLTENGQITADSIDLEAQGAFGGTGALNGYYITLAGGGVLTLNETYPDDAQIDTVNGVSINVNYPLYSLTLTGNEIDIPTGFNGTPEYYEGPTVDLTLTSNAGDDLPGNITLSGNINVDNFDAMAANNITADDTANIYSNYDFQVNAGGNAEIDGTVQANTIEITGANNATISSSGNLTGYEGTQITATSGNVDIEGQVYDNNSVTVNAGGNITTGSNSSVSADDGTGPVSFTSTGGTNTVMLDGDISASTLGITGYNVHTLATEENAGLYASTSINIYATNNVILDGYIQTPSLSVTGIDNGPVPASVTIPSTSQINSDNVQINAGVVDVEGFVTGDLNGSGADGDSGSSLFSVNTTASNVTLPFMGSPDGDTQQDFFSNTGAYIDAQTIQIDSRGDLFLDSIVIPGVDGNEAIATLNGAVIDPYNNLSELDLTGATIEVDADYTYGTTLNLTTTSSDITINANINLGTGVGSEFSANSANNIVFTGNQAITADTVTLTANQILTVVDPTIASGNVTVNVNGANVTLNQIGSPSTFYLNEYDPVTTDQIGSLTLDVSSSSDPSLSVSGNSLVVGDISGTSFNSLTLSLSSLNDINAESGATITAAASLTLQVGVAATLAGDGSSNITYNGGQLTIDDTNLTSFSVTATSVTVNSGFPSLSNAALSLTANGEDEDTGSIAVNTDLNIASGIFTSDNGDITTDEVTTSDGGSLTLTANNGTITTNGALSTGSGGGITLSAGSITTFGSVTTGSGGSISLTALDGNINTYNTLATTGTGAGITLAATNGGISTEGTITTGSGGNLTITTSGNSPTGDINVNGGLSIGGTFTANASGNIFIEFADPTIGSDMSLTAASAIEVDENITISGNLTLNAGTYIHTDDNATIYGATSVTLTLGAPANISETQDPSTLYFGAVSEEEDYQPLAIDLTNVVSNDSYINATATSLTLMNTFDEPNIDLTLTASSGTLTVSGSGSVTADSFTGYSNNGDIVISEPLNLNNGFSASGTNGNIFINSAISAYSISVYTYDSGNITINATQDIAAFYADAENGNLIVNEPVTATQYFEAYATSITGTGSITSPSVSLTQSGTATVGQLGSNQFSYNTLAGVTVSPADGGSYLYLSASPVLLTSDLTLTNGSITLGFGSVNTQGYTITADNVTAEYLNTTTGASGNATNLTVIGNDSVTFDNMTLNGANSTAGSGGTLTATSTEGEGSYATIDDTVSANGGSAGGNGGTITITAGDTINAGDGASLSANGGSGGGNGGTISLTAQNGTIYSLAISANGGDANPTGATAGGNGGTINLTSGAALDIEGSISANGGAANPNSGAAGGNGGTVNIQSNGNITIDNNIVATSGVNGNTKWTGGSGGTVNITSQGDITVNSSIQVSSSNLYTNQVSAKGGNINITSHDSNSNNVAINITDSGQLAALLNQAAGNNGGAITFIADKGGQIAVSGSVRADAGTIKIQTGTMDGSGPGGAVAVSGATLSADVVKVGSLGANGSLTIGNSTINGDTAIELYATGDNGNVIFNGNTFLTGAGLKSIAGSTVTIINGVQVYVSGGAATVYTNTPNYKGSGGNNSTTGQFTGNGAATKPFASRPGF